MLRSIFSLILTTVLTFFCAQTSVWAETDVSSLPISEQWEITQGGKLYDKWFAELSNERPDTTHPAYPKKSKKKGSATWRCKECHGWDYIGKNGRYKKGSHFTNIIGINGQDGKSPKRIAAILRDKNHRYSKKQLPDTAARQLAMFVSKGQKDYYKYLDAKTGKPKKSDSDRGRYLFGVACMRCHGEDGKSINFSSGSKPQYVGTVANDNPPETLHKIRFGQPGTGMNAYGEFFEKVAMGDIMNVADWMNLLAYCQSLPTK